MMPDLPARLGEIWVYLAATPLLGLTLTLAAYSAAFWMYQRSGMHPLANPVALAVLMVMAVLLGSGTAYRTYFEGAQFVHFLLGPATVALAVPLYAQWSRLRAMAVPLLLALLAGAVAAVVSAVGVALLFGASRATLASLAPKSITTPIAMGVAEKIGGLPSLTAVLVVSTGILGAVIGPGLFHRLGVDDDAVRGFSLGVAAHGIGTARAFQLSETAGAFSALAMGLNGLLTALLLPWLARLL
jgi:predicted murein hydrolase (TIGR00659 family)